MSQNRFSEYPLDESIVKSLSVLKYTDPTPVQREVLPLLLNKKDVIVRSQTGSGKTAAFGIPLCQLVDWEERAPQALVLTPTRELATQIKDEILLNPLTRYKTKEKIGYNIVNELEELLENMCNLKSN